MLDAGQKQTWETVKEKDDLIWYYLTFLRGPRNPIENLNQLREDTRDLIANGLFKVKQREDVDKMHTQIKIVIYGCQEDWEETLSDKVADDIRSLLAKNIGHFHEEFDILKEKREFVFSALEIYKYTNF